MLDNPIFRSFVSLMLLFILIFGFKGVKRYLTKILNKLIYVEAYLYASDKANEHTQGNGYGRKRDEELKKKLEEIRFLEK